MHDPFDAAAYYQIAYSLHTIMNPLRRETVQHIGSLFLSKECPRVLDIGSGKGAVALVYAEEFSAECLLVDSSPRWNEHAMTLFAKHGLRSRLQTITTDAATFSPEPASADLLLCIGTSPIFGALDDAIDALLPALAPGGTIVIGEPTIDVRVPRAFARYMDEHEWHILRTDDILLCARDRDLSVAYARRSTTDEWDDYMSMQWIAIENHARRHPKDMEAQRFLSWMRREREMYLRFQRRIMEWTIFCLRRD